MFFAGKAHVEVNGEMANFVFSDFHRGDFKVAVEVG